MSMAQFVLVFEVAEALSEPACVVQLLVASDVLLPVPVVVSQLSGLEDARPLYSSPITSPVHPADVVTVKLWQALEATTYQIETSIPVPTIGECVVPLMELEPLQLMLEIVMVALVMSTEKTSRWPEVVLLPNPQVALLVENEPPLMHCCTQVTPFPSDVLEHAANTAEGNNSKTATCSSFFIFSLPAPSRVLGR
jgi:hypothetical protein